MSSHCVGSMTISTMSHPVLLCPVQITHYIHIYLYAICLVPIIQTLWFAITRHSRPAKCKNFSVRRLVFISLSGVCQFHVTCWSVWPAENKVFESMSELKILSAISYKHTNLNVSPKVNRKAQSFGRRCVACVHVCHWANLFTFFLFYSATSY